MCIINNWSAGTVLKSNCRFEQFRIVKMIQIALQFAGEFPDLTGSCQHPLKTVSRSRYRMDGYAATNFDRRSIVARYDQVHIVP